MLRSMDLLYTAHVPAGDGPHPAILLLHGWGASAHDLIGLAPVLHGGRTLVLCPQGPLAFQAGPGMLGYGWFPLVPGRPPDPAAIETARLQVEAFLDAALARYPIDRARLIVAGFSQGGFLAYQIALRAPARFAGLMALSSWLPQELAERDSGAAGAHAAARARRARQRRPDGPDRARLRVARRAARGSACRRCSASTRWATRSGPRRCARSCAGSRSGCSHRSCARRPGVRRAYGSARGARDAVPCARASGCSSAARA